MRISDWSSDVCSSDLTVADRTLARVVKRCQDLPGQTLFQFVDEDGARHPVTSGDVNAYIRDAAGRDFTAKHFRTWGASVIASATIVEAGEKDLILKGHLVGGFVAHGTPPTDNRQD